MFVGFLFCDVVRQIRKINLQTGNNHVDLCENLARLKSNQRLGEGKSFSKISLLNHYFEYIRAYFLHLFQQHHVQGIYTYIYFFNTSLYVFRWFLKRIKSSRNNIIVLIANFILIKWKRRFHVV